MFRIKVLFLFSFITCHSRISAVLQCAVCSVLLLFFNLCPADYSWIPLELSLLRLFSVVCLRLYILTEKVSLSKKWKSSPLFQNGQTCRLFEPEFVFFFLIKKVVSYCSNVYICSERLDYCCYEQERLSFAVLCLCPQRKYYTPYGKIFVQILWDRISVKAKLLVWACLKKKKKRIENIMGLRKDKIP